MEKRQRYNPILEETFSGKTSYWLSVALVFLQAYFSEMFRLTFIVIKKTFILSFRLMKQIVILYMYWRQSKKKKDIVFTFRIK